MFFKGKPKYTYLLIGLGNYGDKYEATRHNVGFRTVDIIAETIGVTAWKNKHKSLVAEGDIKGNKVLLVKPLTYMNKSGEAVSEIIKFYKLPVNSIIVISDDVSMDVGRLRIRANGSHGGHNGLRDIIELLGSSDFTRIKVGVGQKPHPDYDLADWVLGKPQGDDLKTLTETEKLAADAAIFAVTNGISSTMNKFNR